jgi:iron complex outermembrane receptor protein
MSSVSLAAQRRRICWLATTFLVPVLSSGVSTARAQQVAAALPPIEINAPNDENRTRARPRTDQEQGSRRIAPAPTNRRNAAPSGSRTATGATAVRQFNGIVGASATVITAEEIAHSPAQTLQEIIAQTPGVQLTSLYGGVNGVKTSVDLRGFGAFASSNTLLLINGRRVNDVDMQGVDFSTIRAIRLSASRSPGATAARCSTATTRSAASSTSS